jgi:hypothetical protein
MKKFFFRVLLPIIVGGGLLVATVAIANHYPNGDILIYVAQFIFGPLCPFSGHAQLYEYIPHEICWGWVDVFAIFFVPVLVWNIALHFKRRRVLKGVAIYLLLCVCVFLCVEAVYYYYENKPLKHASLAKDNPLGEKFQRTIDAIPKLFEGLPRLNGSVIEAKQRGLAFDVQSYFTVFTNISMQDGFVLDYAYPVDTSFAAHPTLYSRRADEAPFADSKELWNSPPGRISSNESYYARLYSEHIVINGTEEGYLEYAALHLMGEQFYLSWHALYDDTEIVASKKVLESIINHKDDPKRIFDKAFSYKQKLQACKIDLSPLVSAEGDVVTVSFLTFSKWGGFERLKLEIKKDFPHRILNEEREPLVDYSCGVVF